MTESSVEIGKKNRKIFSRGFLLAAGLNLFCLISLLFRQCIWMFVITPRLGVQLTSRLLASRIKMVKLEGETRRIGCSDALI